MEMPVRGYRRMNTSTRLCYEKDGVKKEFSLEDYPANDSSWTFVDSKTELVKKGYQLLLPLSIFTMEREMM